MQETTNQTSNTTSSLQPEVTPPSSPITLPYSMKGDERIVAVLAKKVEDMERELHDLKVKKILDETQLPTDLLVHNNLLPHPPRKLMRGKGYRPILRSEIEEAKKHSPFGAGQARWLGISLCTYKKYAKLYGLWEPRPDAKGKTRVPDPNGGKYPLNRILDGDFNGNKFVTDWKVKKKIYRNQTFPIECALCGYNKTRLKEKWPILLLDHMDGDRTNFKRDNIRLLCWNCTIECGRGYLRRRIHMFDPEL